MNMIVAPWMSATQRLVFDAFEFAGLQKNCIWMSEHGNS